MNGGIRAFGAVTDGRGTLTFRHFGLPAPAEGEVLVEMRAAGVCHTDWDLHRTRPGLAIMGHEGAGVVLRTGANAGEFQPGDRVVSNWAIPCRRCVQCRLGNPNICQNKPGLAHPPVAEDGAELGRSFGLGMFATHALVRREALTRLPDEIPFASASILGCGVMTGVGSVINAARLLPGSSVVVLGCGGVGLNIVQGARIAGAGRIIAVDLHERRLNWARDLGATDAIQARRNDAGLAEVGAEVMNMTGGTGADYAFEATAAPELGDAPLAMIRHGGMAVQASGIEQVIPFNMRLFEWDKLYINPKYGKCDPERDLPKLFGWYRSGDLKLDELITRQYALEDLQQAFDDMNRGVNAKGVLVMSNDASL